MNSKKIVSLLAAAAMVASSLTGCGATATSSSTSSSTPSSVAPPAQATPGEVVNTYPIVTDGSVTLKYWTELNGSASKFIQSYAENTAYQEMEKRTGVKIDFIHPAIGQVQEQFNLLMASGDLPDILGSANKYKGGEFQGMYDGFFQDITDLLPQYAPDYLSYIQKDEEFFREVSNDDGRITGFYGYKPFGDPPFERVVLRQDVLAELDMEIPKTLDDYEKLFAAMLSKGITPFMLGKDGYNLQFSGMFGAPTTRGVFYKDESGKVVFNQVSPGFKEYLTLMNSWYQKGYISKDFTTVDTNQTNTLFDTKKIGTFIGPIVANFNRGATQGIEVTSAPYPRLKEGDQLHYENTNIWPLVGKDSQMAVVTKNCKNLEAAVRWLNYGYTPEGADLMNWGVEGVNYDVKDGKKVYNDTMLANSKFGTEEASYIYKMHFAPKAVEFDTICHANLLKSPDALASRFKWADDPNIDSSYQLPPFQLSTDEQNKVTNLMTEINTYADEMVLKFITGAEPIASFDKYVETINSMGLPEVLQIRQAAYDRYMQKKMG